MKKSFRTIVFCLLGAVVLSAGAGHIKSKTKPAFLKSFHQIQVKEKVIELLVGRDSDRHYFHIVMQDGSASFYATDAERPRASDFQVRLVDNKLLGHTESDVYRRDGEDLYVVGERAGTTTGLPSSATNAKTRSQKHSLQQAVNVSKRTT